MRKILVTGGTVFVSRYVAEYFRDIGDEVFVLNRSSRPQSEGVTTITADRHSLGEKLKGYRFDAVLDVTAYTGDDVKDLLNALGSFGSYILVSSSAVYPETSKMPCTEETPVGKNSVWGAYGLNKIGAERELTKRVPEAYILRPPYLYGAMENVYREPFVFECAEKNRTFALPPERLNLQFFHVGDLCRFMDILLCKRPKIKVFNVGNKESVCHEEWVKLCYNAVGREADFFRVPSGHFIRDYFPLMTTITA